MLADNLLYVFLLVLSIAVGPLIRKQIDLSTRQNLSTACGIILGFASSGFHVFHIFFTTLFNIGIITVCPKRICPAVSFVFNFLYLGFFRTAHYFGLPSPPSHANALQMILTLKMVGLAFELHHIGKLKKNASPEHEAELKRCFFNLKPIDVFHYAFCHAGILIGPYYKYRTYVDMLQAPFVNHIPLIDMVKERASVTLLYAVLYLICDYCFPLEFATSKEIQEMSVWYRIFYMSPLFFAFRMRMYIGFILGECVCIAAGLGLYPSISKPQPGVGPTDFEALQDFMNCKEKWSEAEYDYETVHTIDEYNSEFQPTIRGGIRYWNRTVQYWLAVFVYQQMPFSKPIRMVLVMLTSAYWHGVYPGYYLCLCSAPLFLMAEAQMEAAFKKGASQRQQVVFDSVCWFLKMQAFSYMGMAFLLLRIDTTLVYWRSIYFVGHVLIVAFFTLGYFWKRWSKISSNNTK